MNNRSTQITLVLTMIAMTLIIAFSFTACGSNSAGEAAGEDPERVLNYVRLARGAVVSVVIVTSRRPSVEGMVWDQ